MRNDRIQGGLPAGGARACLALACLCAGCEGVARVSASGGGAFREADTPFAPAPGDASRAASASIRPAPGGVVLGIVQVQVPHDRRAAADQIWRHVREDVLDAALQMRLWHNGLRVGVGHERWWGQIKSQFDRIDGCRVQTPDPLLLPPALPLGLELDQEPRDQTLFYLGPDGILSGESWPASANVLRLVQVGDPRRAERVLLSVTPQVRQRLDGLEWARTSAGLMQRPRVSEHDFVAVAFHVSLARGEFLVVAPSDRSDVYGLIGGVMLTSVLEDQRYHSFLFLSPHPHDERTSGD